MSDFYIAFTPDKATQLVCELEKALNASEQENAKLKERIAKLEKVREAASFIDWLCTQQRMENLHKALKNCEVSNND